MANSVNNQETFEQELQSYIEQMDQELAAAQALLQAMGNTNAQEGQDESIINREKTALTLFENMLYQEGLTYNDVNSIVHKKFASYYAAISNISVLNATISADEAQLEAIDPNVTSTINALQELNEQAESMLHEGLRTSDLDKSFQQISTIFRQLCNVIQNEIQTDLAMAGMKKFGSGANGGSAILQFAGIAIQAEFQEQTNLQGIQSDVINDSVGWQQEKSDAEADLDTSHWYDFFTGGGPDSSKDHAKIRAANAMISILAEVETVVSSMITVVDPGMQEFQYELQNLKAQFDKILAGHGTIQQVKDAMIEALSILVAIIAETQNDSSAYDKEMNQGSMASSQMHLNDSLAQQEVIDDAQKYAAIMGKLLGAAKYIGLGLIFLVNPGIAMAVMVALQAALTASGEMDELQNALSDKLGTVGGAAMTAGIEIVVTAGGAAAIDALIQKAAQAAAASVMDEAAEEVEASGDQEAEKAVNAAIAEGVAKAMEDVIETTTQTAVKTLQGAAEAADEAGAIDAEAALAGVQNVSAESMAAARQVVEKAVTQAVEDAQKKVTLAFMSKTVTETITSFIRGDLRMAMAAAMKEAAENAGKEIQVLAETAAKQASADVIGEQEIVSIAQTSATKAVADAMKMTEESVSNLNKMTLIGERTAVKKAIARGAFTGMGAMGSTGLPTALMAQIKGEKEKDLSQGMQIAMEVIQALMQLIGTIGASDIGVQSVMAQQGSIPKLLLVTQTVDSGMQAIGTGGEAEASIIQAHAVQAIAKDQSVLDMMQFVMSQLAKDGQIQRDTYSKEMQTASRSNMKLAMHFTDADQEVAQALAVLAV